MNAHPHDAVRPRDGLRRRHRPRPRIPVALAASALLAGCSTDAPSVSPDGAASPGETLFTESPPAWFEAYFAWLDVAPDGRRALLDGRRLIDLETGREIPLDMELERISTGAFDNGGALIVRGGPRDGEQGWFRVGEPDGSADPLPQVPSAAWPIWSPSGNLIAYLRWPGADASAVGIGPADGSTAPVFHAVPGEPDHAAWLGGDSGLLVLVRDDRGTHTLYALDLATGDTRTIATGLDGRSNAQIAVAADASVAYVALASDGVPSPILRHEPDVDRDLDIWAVDLADGAMEPVIETPAEDLAPVVAGETLYWQSIETRSEAVIVPAEGGEAGVVAEGVQGPTWRPDGRAIGVTTGSWRLADWALNLDAGIVEIDAEGRPTSGVTPIVTGYHEDFSPAWSPDGSWIAYHSHRSPTPVVGYAAEGSTDDIFVRRPGAPTSEEIRLTDFGWEVGTPDWAPGGRRMLIVSWDREEDREPGGRGASAWVVELDPRTGAFVDRIRVRPRAGAPGIPVWGAWSPTRDEIALTFSVPSSGDVELWVMAPDGGSPRRVIGFAGHRLGGVDWAADGDALVYSALADGRQQLFSVARSGGEPRQLTDDPANLFHPQVSPDGRWIAATRIRHDKRVVRRP